MAKTTILPFIRELGIVLIVLWSLGIKAQTNNSATLIWDNQVGCIEYDYDGRDPKNGFVFDENVENRPCVRVCEKSTVNYTVQGEGIAYVDWVITGGNLIGTSGGNNQNAEVQWGNAGNGVIHVTITYTNQSVKAYTPCIEIIHSPKALFKIEGLNDEKTFCLNAPIIFDNLSIANGGTEIIYYNWDFGDGNYSNEFEPTHSYDQPGYYEVTLVVINKCNCIDKYRMTINIIERRNIEIWCPSVVCENGDIVTYSVNEECGGEWLIEGGTVVGQSPQQIDVIWDKVDQDGFGYVNFKSACGCPFWTTVKVPVVQQKGFIKGANVACLNEQTRYTLPQWPTTDFQWSINDNPLHPMLVYTDQRNEVYVNGLTPGTYTLKCNYTNTLLRCSGLAEKIITVLPSVTITGPEEFCSGSGTISYTNTEGISVNWELKKNNNVIVTSTGVNFNHNFNQGGTYVLTATSSDGCFSEPFIINVIQTPTISESIIGENLICPGVAYNYSYNNTDNNYILHWEVCGGSIQGSNIGDEINVIFNNTGPYKVRVKKVSLTGGCESEWLEKNITKLDFTPIIVNNDGLSGFCPSSETTFSVNIGGIIPDFIEWEIKSVGNGPSNTNFGNIISGVNSTDVTVSFNEISISPNGILEVTVYKCGIVKKDTFLINLMPQPDLAIIAPTKLCANESFDITLTSSIPLTSGTIVWTVNGQTYTQNIATDGLTLTDVTIDNIEPNNLSVAITASVTHPNGCLYNLTANKTVTIEPRPVVQISPGYLFEVCPDDNGVYDAISFNANTNYNNSMPISFQWFKNGILMPGETSSSLTIPAGTTSPEGTYYVVVTFINTEGNCSTKSSNVIVTSENCVDPQLCNLGFLPNLSITGSWTDCNRIDFVGTFDNPYGYATQINWLSSNSTYFVGYNNNTATPHFITDKPGEYLVQFEVFYFTPQGPCRAFKTIKVKKHYEPKFNYTISCDGANNYTANLINNSTLFDVLSGDLNYNYSTTSGTLSQSGTGASITNLGPGSHTFTLELTSGSIDGAPQPSCTYEVQVNIDPLDVPVLTYPSPHQLFCAEDVITLSIPGGYNPNYSYTWHFDNTSYQATEEHTDINITNSIPTNIVLRVTNEFGCWVESNSIPIKINKASFQGTLNPNTLSFCEGVIGDSIEYSNIDSSSSLPTQYIWMKGNQEVGVTTTPSFTPTESGNYWVRLLDENGCRFGEMASNPVNVVVRKRPYVNIIGETNLCIGESATLQGIVPDSNLQRRWLLNGSPMAAPYGTWSTTTPLTPVVYPTVSGTYTYTLQVRPANDFDCGNEQDFMVTLSPTVSVPILDYDIISCEPYTVKIGATGPSDGNYNWSNGDTGQIITVNNGGVYQVTYTAPSGCSVSTSITVPHASDRYMWIFPTGCFDVCPFNAPKPYIIGPLATFDNYTWLVNGHIALSGSNSPVQSLMVSQAGTYQLIVQNDGCIYKSGIAYITPDPERCELEPCNVKAFFKRDMKIEHGEYFLMGGINNPNSFPITVSLSSFNGYGTYIPGTVTIPAGGTYNLTPLTFIPNQGFTGGMDYIVIQILGQNCMTLHQVDFPSLYGVNSISSTTGIENAPYLNVSPNPASSIVAIDYDISQQYERADEIQIHDLNGRLLMRLPVNNAKGQKAVNVSSWQSATYIVSLYADGKRVLHQKLLVR